MIIHRILEEEIKRKLQGEPRVIVLYGPRQSGKTFLLRHLLEERKQKVLFLRGEDIQVQKVFSQPEYKRIKEFIGDTELLVIDEAQKIDNIGESLKLLFDTSPMPIIISGSASFDLANKVAEPMTGRATLFTLYPLALAEVPVELPDSGIEVRLFDYLRFGMYPKIHVLSNVKDKEEYLYDVINTYLANDLLTFKEIKKPRKILDLLSLLAFQIGQEVNIEELSKKLLLNRETVEKYLDVLEKMFILVNLRGFSRNLRKEITKTSKYYFTDLGIRNAVIRNFKVLDERDDVGRLYENFCVIERFKKAANQKKHASFYFWRTYDQKEIDLVEEAEGRLRTFEFKFGNGKISKAAKKEFSENYPGSEFKIITPEALKGFLG